MLLPTEKRILKPGGTDDEKYIVYKVAVLLLCTALLTGCGQKDKAALPEDFPIDFVFSSGVGAWATSMTLEQDGAFSGEYYDADMGVCDEDYPNGTVYICDFRGGFRTLKKWTNTVIL